MQTKAARMVEVADTRSDLHVISMTVGSRDTMRCIASFSASQIVAKVLQHHRLRLGSRLCLTGTWIE